MKTIKPKKSVRGGSLRRLARPTRLRWTTPQPVAAGWYLWRTDECGDLPVQCYREDGELHLTFVDGFYIGPTSWTHGGRWAGPLARKPRWPSGALTDGGRAEDHE
jgi:hypothetical protein